MVRSPRLRRHNALPGHVQSASDLVRAIREISPRGIRPFGVRETHRVVGRGKSRRVVYETHPSQEYTDIPLYLRDKRGMGIDEIADALGIPQGELIEALRTISRTREHEAAGGRSGDPERDIERMAEAEARAYEASRSGIGRRLAAEGMAGTHTHRITVYHAGPDPRGGEWFRAPFAKLGVGLSQGENPRRKQSTVPQAEMFSARAMVPAILPGKLRPTVEQAAAGDELLAAFRRPEHSAQRELFGGKGNPMARKSLTRGLETATRKYFPCPECDAPQTFHKKTGRVYGGHYRWCSLARKGNPLTREETAQVLRSARAYARDAHAARPGSTGHAYNLGRADGLLWTAKTFRGHAHNPAYSAYFLKKGGGITEKYFHATSLRDAKAQAAQYAASHGLRPSTLWALQATTAAGRKFSGEWARPLTTAKGDADMALWLDNPKKHHRRHHRRNVHRGAHGRYVANARHHRRHRYNDPDPVRRHRYNRRRHYRRNPDVASMGSAFSRPGALLAEAGFGILGAYGVIAGGNAVGNMLLPTQYQDLTLTGSATRLIVRGGVGWAVDRFLAGGLAMANRTALRVGMAVGVVGSFALSLLNTSINVGAGDTSMTFGTLLAPVGLAGFEGAGAYVPARMPRGGIGAYVRSRPTQRIAGLGDIALGMDNRLLYTSFR